MSHTRVPGSAADPDHAGHHKLIDWGFVTHGCIDGKTRACVFLRCLTNNTQETVFASIKEAVQKWGKPSRVRANKGGENLLVGKWMVINQGPGRGSSIQGKSCHNQRIERMWRDVFATAIRDFYAIFRSMEDGASRILDCHWPLHIWVLHLVYLPLINRLLDCWVEMHNHHPIRTENNLSPIKLMDIGKQQASWAGFSRFDNADEVADSFTDNDFHNWDEQVRPYGRPWSTEFVNSDEVDEHGHAYPANFDTYGQSNFSQRGIEIGDPNHHREIPKIDLCRRLLTSLEAASVGRKLGLTGSVSTEDLNACIAGAVRRTLDQRVPVFENVAGRFDLRHGRAQYLYGLVCVWHLFGLARDGSEDSKDPR